MFLISETADSYTDMQKHSKEEKYNSAYVIDKNSELAE